MAAGELAEGDPQFLDPGLAGCGVTFAGLGVSVLPVLDSFGQPLQSFDASRFRQIACLDGRVRRRPHLGQCQLRVFSPAAAGSAARETGD